ncbi:MAG: glyoxalase/bleomycin resistance/extradiol dioxygenase family protein [Gemmatimonadaceae bacterium]|nr:glyoxalase/bleomycin resistance/extradiol dioxygenase family protein [Gemmatimonadaceae bacterium]
MSTSQSPAPRIKHPATKAATPRKLFVNVPVADVQRSIDFFEALGFSFSAQFTDATAAAMLVGEDAYFMLLAPDKFASFTKRPQGDPKRETNALFALGVGSRAEVDAMVKKAVALGGSHALDPHDHGFMYGWSFYDLDGHHWEVLWMDAAVVRG